MSLATLGEAGTVGTTLASPTSVPVGEAKPVLITSVITDPDVIPDTVNLQRLDSAGRVVAILGTLRDDGTNMDATAGDKTYSVQIIVFETSTGPITFRVSAGFRGSLLRAFSAPVTVNVVGATGTGISFLSPANLAYVNVSPINVSGTVGDPGAQVTVNGIAAPVSSSRFALTVPLLEGNNTLTAVARNTGGSVNSASIQVTLDTTPPQISIDSPPAGFITTAQTVNVAGTVNDIVVGTVNPLQATVTVNGVNAQVTNRSFLALNVPLTVGANTIRAVGRDRSGNSATASLEVRREVASSPSIRLVSGNNQTGPIGTALAAPLVVALTDGAGAAVPNKTVVFKVTENNGLVAAGGTPAQAVAANTNSLGQAQVRFTLGSRAGAGNNRVEAAAVGFAGTAIFTASATPTTATKINVDSGNNQTAALGQALAFPFVAVVTDNGHNRVANVSVTFTVKQGGGHIGGSPSITTRTDGDGRALAVLTLGTEPGFDNNIVEATFPGNPGLPAAFVASAKLPGNPDDTRITGVVLDNSNTPIPGVTIRLFKTNQGVTNNVPVPVGTPVQTNAQGQFLIQPAPIGYFKLMADGTTVTGASYPTLEYDIVTVAGENNTVGMPIYLPRLDTINRLCVTETTGGTLTLPQVPGFSLRVASGSATFPGGSRSGCISVTPVNGDKVPMTPGFGQQPRFIVTIQPVGTTFNPPAPITIPNVDGLTPGQITELYSYDHDLAAFVAIGTGTVSQDGSVIASNPGVGILKAGWHCGGNPSVPGSAGTCLACEKCEGSQCVPDRSRDCNDCGPDHLCQNGTCKLPTVAILDFATPSADGKTAGASLSFVSTDTLLLTAASQPDCPRVSIEWTAPDIDPFNGTLDPRSATGTRYTFKADPFSALNEPRPSALSYSISATIRSYRTQFIIRQDEIDFIREQYIDMLKLRTPVRAEFINSGQSSLGHFTFANISSRDGAPWAIFSIFEQMERWFQNWGGPMIVTRGYSTPRHNATIQGAAVNSQHIYGTAADVASNSANWAAIRQAAKAAGACTEPLDISGPGHVHADWRGSCPANW